MTLRYDNVMAKAVASRLGERAKLSSYDYQPEPQSERHSALWAGALVLLAAIILLLLALAK